MLDALDSTAVDILARQGRISWADLGEKLGLSPPAAAERVRRLEAQGVILGFAAVVAPPTVGYPLLAFIGVTLDHVKHRPAFLRLVEKLPQILECHHVAGEEDFVLKVRCRDIQDLETLITEQIKGLTGVARTRTSIALSTVKETFRLPPVSFPP